MSRAARIALVQLPAFGMEDAERSLAHTLQRIDEAARSKPDLIALPEVTYPAYFLGTRDLASCGVLSPSEAAGRFAAKAREHGVYLAAGLALDAPGGGYTNGAALFDRDGSLVGRYDKSLLWHFDARWFTPGGAYPVFETDFGRVGILVCADGRLPEIARSLVLNGAQLVLDLTAWVSAARRVEDLMNVQREYMMLTRAAENGVWTACVSKFGIEAESIVYCGRSCFIDPAGTVVSTLGADDDAVLLREVPMIDPAPPVVRRPALYDALAQPTESLAVVRQADEPFVMQDSERRIAAVQMAVPAEADAFLSAARGHVERLALQDADLVLLPPAPPSSFGSWDADSVAAAMCSLAAEHRLLLCFTLFDSDGYRVMRLAGPSGVVAAHRQTHAPAASRLTMLGDEPCPVVNTAVGRIGMICSSEALVPEVPRSLMLRGAEILLMSANAPELPMTTLARTRADENRVFVAAATGPGERGGTLVVDPAGRVLAQALADRELSISATVNRALSHLKAMAPGTDIVRDRQPATYAVITRAETPAGRVL